MNIMFCITDNKLNLKRASLNLKFLFGGKPLIIYKARWFSLTICLYQVFVRRIFGNFMVSYKDNNDFLTPLVGKLIKENVFSVYPSRCFELVRVPQRFSFLYNCVNPDLKRHSCCLQGCPFKISRNMSIYSDRLIHQLGIFRFRSYTLLLISQFSEQICGPKSRKEV